MPGIRQDGGRWAVSWSTDTEEVTDLATAVVNGRRVIVGGGADKALRLWDPVAGGQVGKPLTGHLAPVIAIATIELDERPHVITAAMDGTARLWDLACGHQLGRLGSHPATKLSGMSLAKQTLARFAGFSGHQPFTVATATVGAVPVAVVGGEDGARVWDLAAREVSGEPLTDELVMTAATAEVDGRAVAVTSGPPGSVRLWDLETRVLIGRLPSAVKADGMVTRLTVEEVGDHAVILTVRIRSSGPNDIQMWDPVTCLPIGRPLEDQGSRFLISHMTVAVLDGRACVIAGGAIAAGSGIPGGRGRLVAWDADTCEKVGESDVFPSAVSAVIPYPDGPAGSLAIACGRNVAVLTPR